MCYGKVIGQEDTIKWHSIHFHESFKRNIDLLAKFQRRRQLHTAFIFICYDVSPQLIIEEDRHFSKKQLYCLKSRIKCQITSESSSSYSLLSIVSDDDISVGFRPLRALLVGERTV